MKPIILSIAAALYLVTSHSALAAEADRKCLECHNAQHGSASAKNPDLGVAMEAYRASVHSTLACVDCHTDATGQECKNLNPVDCGSCHATEKGKFMGGAHGMALITAGSPVSCSDCHGTHDTLSKDNPKSSVYPTALPETCGKCHDSESHSMQKRARGVTLEDYVASIHYSGLTDDGLLGSASCISCHGNHGMLATTDPESRVHRDNIPRMCGSCHEGTFDEYIKSAHGVALTEGSADTPICTDCHGEHAIFDHEDPRSTVHATKISTSTCPQCHSAEHINRRYALAEGQVETYKDTFHGLADQFGADVANCASCHEAHFVLGASDPRSSVHKDNLPATCAKCHPGAGPNFAQGSVHRPSESAGAPYFRFVDYFYVGVITLTLGGMLLHNGLDYFTTMRARYRAGRRKRRYVRFEFGERIQHVALVLSFVVLAFTGFALKYPQAFWVQWLLDSPASFLVRTYAHRVAAIVFVGLSLYHVVYLFGTRRGRVQLKAMKPTRKDLGDLRQQFGYFLGLRKAPPRFSRFSYAEKFEYLALVWGSIIMVVTGFILWFEVQALGWMPKWAWDLAELIHLYEAWLATLSILVWHLYHVAFRPSGHGVSLAMMTGELTEEEMEHEHGGELEEIAAGRTDTSRVLVPGETQAEPILPGSAPLAPSRAGKA